MSKILDWIGFNEGYNKPRAGGKRRWSVKYKRKIDCSNAKGFSQKQYCKRKRRGGAYKNESVNTDPISRTLNDIFLEISDNSNWFVWVEGDSRSNLYEIYISFGDDEPYNNNDEEFGYEQKKIPDDLIDCVKRSIEFMDSNDFRHNILFCTEYSSDPSEDYIEKIDTDDLYKGMIMSENEAIRIKFSY